MHFIFSLLSSIASIAEKLIPDAGEARRRKIVESAAKDRDLVRRWALHGWLRDHELPSSPKQKRRKADAKAGRGKSKEGRASLV